MILIKISTPQKDQGEVGKALHAIKGKTCKLLKRKRPEVSVVIALLADNAGELIIEISGDLLGCPPRLLLLLQGEIIKMLAVYNKNDVEGFPLWGKIWAMPHLPVSNDKISYQVYRREG